MNEVGMIACVLVALWLGVLYDVIVVLALRHWLRELPSAGDEPLISVTFLRPIKPGVPRLRQKLDALVASSEESDQIIFGVDPDSVEEAVCLLVRDSHPQRDITIVRCAAGAAYNPKISKLVQMEEHAQHEAWLLSDSEVLFDPVFLAAFRREWRASRAVALTAAYRFVSPVSGPQQCDALALLLGLWPGLALLRRFGQVDFTLGACTLLRRHDLAAVGGWQAFGEALAEDHQLGAALIKEGRTIRLSRHIATLDCDELTWDDYWRHQRRVAVTYRTANPAGFAGVILTQAVFWGGGLWTALAIGESLHFHSASSLPFVPQAHLLGSLLVAGGMRQWRLQWMTRSLKFPVAGLRQWWPLASMVEALCWLLSWFSARVWWSGRWWRVSFRGRIAPADEPDSVASVKAPVALREPG